MDVGVLALQGDFEPHQRMLQRLDVAAELVRSREQLDIVSHLIVPGGESTTLHHLLELFGMWERLRERHELGELALFGTCAGAILLGSNPPGGDRRPPRLGLLDAAVARNAYGRQIDSFTATVEIDDAAAETLGAEPLRANFIRAPRITSVGPGVRVLARLRGDPVLVEGPGLLAATFHPELADDLRVHRRFLASNPRAQVTACAR